MFVHGQVKQKTKKLVVLVIGRIELKIICIFVGLPADVFGVRLSRIHLSPTWGRNECVTNEPQRTFAERLHFCCLLIKSQNAPLNGIVEVLIMVSFSVVFGRSKATYILQLCIL